MSSGCTEFGKFFLKLQELLKRALNQSSLAVFTIVTIVFIASRFMLFNGFNGSDDLHYAMLSARMLRGEYNPFQPNDIFSGRVLLIAWQALIYKAGGITSVTTGIGTTLALISSCYLSLTKILPNKNPASTLLFCSLFYFSLPLSIATVGISPDHYILLLGICIFLVVKRILRKDQSYKSDLINSLIAGILIGIGLLIKETILLFLPFSMIIVLLFKSERRIMITLCLLFSFMLTVALMGLGYYYFTGDFFFKISQIQNSTYNNACNFTLLPGKDLFIRLTYGIWQSFTVLGFYPFVLGAMILLVKIFSSTLSNRKNDFEACCFAVMLILSIYFPFSIEGYQPLCAAPRHFFFIIPFAVTVITMGMESAGEKKYVKQLLALGSLVILMICLFNTLSRWQWMIYALLFMYYSSQLLIRSDRRGLSYILFSAILFLSIFGSLFFKDRSWYKEMAKLNKGLNSNMFYFPDHDNMMHWKLLNRFDEKSIRYYNIEQSPFKIFKSYYQNPDSLDFRPGWLIVNKAYTTCSPAFLSHVDSIRKAGFFPQYMEAGNLSAFFIDRKQKLAYLRSIVSIR